jgi:hypothetical protein
MPGILGALLLAVGGLLASALLWVFTESWRVRRWCRREEKRRQKLIDRTLREG